LRRLFTWLIKFEPRWRNLEDPFEEDEPHVAGLRGFRKPMHGKHRKNINPVGTVAKKRYMQMHQLKIGKVVSHVSLFQRLRMDAIYL